MLFKQSVKQEDQLISPNKQGAQASVSINDKVETESSSGDATNNNGQPASASPNKSSSSLNTITEGSSF